MKMTWQLLLEGSKHGTKKEMGDSAWSELYGIAEDAASNAVYGKQIHKDFPSDEAVYSNEISELWSCVVLAPFSLDKQYTLDHSLTFNQE